MYEESFLGLTFTLLLAMTTMLFLILWLYQKKVNWSINAQNIQLKTELSLIKIHEHEKQSALLQSQEDFKTYLKSVSSDVLQQTNESFLNLAQQNFKNWQMGSEHRLEKNELKMQEMLSPLKESLKQVNDHMKTLEESRLKAYEGLKEQVSMLYQSQKELRTETGQLVRALRSPISRGRWGEVQLKRVIEMAGMVEYCDFTQQKSYAASESSEHRLIRPDVVVHLPGKKTIVIDAKTPLEAYLDSMEATNEDLKHEHLIRHARHVKEHIKALGQKSYWSQFEQSPEFVVMFLPGDHFYSAALEVEPSLIEYSAQLGVILSTPTTLIALLRAVAYGWRQESLAENAKQISAQGSELYKRLTDMTQHFSSLGQNLNRAVESYNKTLGSYEHRVMVSAKRLHELNVEQKESEIASPAQVTTAIREIQLVEAK